MTREESRDRLKHLLDNIPKEPPTECDNEQEWLYENEEIRKAIETAIQSLSAEPCEDAISRQAVVDGLASIAKAKAKSDAQKSLMGRVMVFTEQLPPVTPKPKVGKWIDKTNEYPFEWECSNCGGNFRIDTSYCPYCGSHNRTDQVSE